MTAAARAKKKAQPAPHRTAPAPSFTGGPDLRPAVAKKKAKVDHSGFATFLSFVDPSDPEAPTTVRGHSRSRIRRSTAEQGRVARRSRSPIADRSRSSTMWSGAPAARVAARALTFTASTRRAASGQRSGRRPTSGRACSRFPQTDSNALLVSAKDSANGHPLAVMGPQVSYFTPEILMEEDIHGPGIDADGAAFPGVNLYVQLGHGRDYAWSATSAGQNIVDTFAVPLCNPGGGTVSTCSTYYVLHGQCVAMETLTRTESWQPSLADTTPAGLDHPADPAHRVRARDRPRTRRRQAGRLHEPALDLHARARLRARASSSTTTRSVMRNPQDFFNAASNIGYTFNWFYTDDKHIAYFNSGHNPVRARNTDPLFPSWARDSWVGFHPAPRRPRPRA